MENPTQDRTTSVYRYYDEARLLLYVGITSAGTLRNRQHNADKEWWQWVVSQDVDHFGYRAEAHAREVALIQKFRPPFNIQHNPDHKSIRAAYLAARASGIYNLKPTAKGLTPKQLQITVDVRRLDLTTGTCELHSRFTDAIAISRLEMPSPVKYRDRIGYRIGTLLSLQAFGPVALFKASVKPGWEFDNVTMDLKPISKDNKVIKDLNGLVRYEIARAVSHQATNPLLIAERDERRRKKAAEYAASKEVA